MNSPDMAPLVFSSANSSGRYFGLRIGDFVSLRQGLFEGNLKDSDAPYSLGVIITEKRKQPAYPFLDYEAYQAFLDWKQELQALNKWDGKDKYMLSGRPDCHMTGFPVLLHFIAIQRSVFRPCLAIRIEP